MKLLTYCAHRRSANNKPFEVALKAHIDKLDPIERAAFQNAYQNITPDALFTQIASFDDEHKSSSLARKTAEPLSLFFKVLDQFMNSVSIAIQANPDISSLVVGGFRLILDVSDTNLSSINS